MVDRLAVRNSRSRSKLGCAKRGFPSTEKTSIILWLSRPESWAGSVRPEEFNRHSKLPISYLAPASDLKSSPDFFPAQSRDTDDFIAAEFAGRYGNGGRRHFQKICEE